MSSNLELSETTSKVEATCQTSNQSQSEATQIIRRCIRKLVHSGSHTLDNSWIQKLKEYVRDNETNTRLAFEAIMDYMRKKHAEVRRSAVLLIEYMVTRSPLFRSLLCDALGDYMRYALGIVFASGITLESLPQPKKAADEMKQKVLQNILCWSKLYGECYPRFNMAYVMLHDKVGLDFESGRSAAEIQTEMERVNEEQLQKREELDRITKQIDDNITDIEEATKQMENCLELILPSPDDPFNVIQSSQSLSSPDDAGTPTLDEMRRTHGISSSVNITVNISPVLRIVETADNRDILVNLADLQKLAERSHLATIKRWLHSITKLEASEVVVKRLIDLKQRIEAAMRKCDDLRIASGDNGDDYSSTDDESFVEVEEKEGLETVIPPHRRKDYGLEPLPTFPTTTSNVANSSRHWRVGEDEESEADPTSRVAQLKRVVQRYARVSDSSQSLDNSALTSDVKIDPSAVTNAKDTFFAPSTSNGNSTKDYSDRKRKLLEKAPKRNFDIDLYHWEDDSVEPIAVIPVDSNHGFYRPKEPEVNSVLLEEAKSMIRERKIEFSGSFEPVKWACRAPLPNGKLCPRRDRIKCPFHGKIVPRDEQGQVINSDDLLVDQPSTSSGVPDWQDPQLLREIKAEIGIDLRMPERGKRGKRKPNSSDDASLTNLRKLHDSPRKRLEKKVFNKASIRRVANTMNAIDRTKFHDKFGHQWNYVLKN